MAKKDNEILLRYIIWWGHKKLPQVGMVYGKFPEGYRFQLSKDELIFVRSKKSSSRDKMIFSGNDGGRRYLPYAFTEQGVMNDG